jgi:ribulose-phosphate 3-epimerase
MPEVLPKLAELREMGFSGELEMDGGIDPTTIARCASAGCNVFVSGTGVFGAEDMPARIAAMRELARSAATG